MWNLFNCINNGTIFCVIDDCDAIRGSEFITCNCFVGYIYP